MPAITHSAPLRAILALIAFVALSSGTTYVVTGSYALAGLASASTLLIGLVIVRYVLVTPEQSRPLVAAAIATHGFSLAALIVLAGSSAIWRLVQPILAKLIPWVEFPELQPDSLTLAVIAGLFLFATVATVAVVLHYTRATAGTLRKPTLFTRKQLESIVRSLSDHVVRLDQELSFFDFKTSATNPLLEPLNVLSRFAISLSPMRVVSRAKDWEVIVVKGEPGSGKSVMLRSLATQLLPRVYSGGKIPLLLNLRDWEPPLATDPAGDCSASLLAWIKKEFASRVPGQNQEQVFDQFQQLYSEGAIIFLLDSFDEISVVNQADHNDQAIRDISAAIVKMIASSGGCVGVLFSRDFKSPVIGWVEHSLYGVKPFSDRDVKRYVSSNCSGASALRKAIFSQRPDLYAISKSPFLLALTVDYCNRSNGALPGSEFNLFDAFIGGRVGRACEQVARDHPQDAVVAFAKMLAQRIQAQGASGANAIITNEMERQGFEPNLSILIAARLTRRSGDTISFSHRRIQEYFLVLRMIDGEDRPPLFAVDRMGSIRDALTLYAQICRRDEAERLALAAYGSLRRNFREFRISGSPASYSRIVLSFRFLRQAFRNRADLLLRHRRGLRYWTSELWASGDLLKRKHAVENIALIPPPTAAWLVRESLRGASGWLRRTALAEARYLSTLRPWLGRAVAAYASELSDTQLIVEYGKKNIVPPLSSADRLDQILFVFDAALRLLIMLAFFAAVYWSAPLPSTGIFVLVLFCAFLILGSGSSQSIHDYMFTPGYNSGVTGFIVAMTYFGLFWNILGASLGPRHFFWTMPNAWISAILMLLGIGMLSNNYIIRERDRQNSLGTIALFEKGVIGVPTWSRSRLLKIARNNWIFLCLVVAVVASFFYEDASHLVGGILLFVLLAIAVGIMASL